MSKRIFVFGSNLAGIHGAGAAAHAHRHLGAVWGVGCGPTGDCYAIPTKDKSIRSLRLKEIQPYVNQFMDHATFREKDQFLVTRIGCGLAGFKDEDIGPMFRYAPINCVMPVQWQQFLYKPEQFNYHFEGTPL